MKNIEEIINEDRNLTILSRGIIATDLKRVWAEKDHLRCLHHLTLHFH